jgi:hypothetical protein
VPSTATLAVTVNDRVVAGVTVIARLAGHNRQITDL